jgi:pimaricinolide synthase PimS1
VAPPLALLHALGPAGLGGRLWCMTAGAVSTDRGELIGSAVQAEVWGMGRVAALEQPGRWGGVLDLPTEVDTRAAARIVGVLAQGDEDQLAVRAGGWFGRRMVPAPLPPGEPARRWTPRDTVLVTGRTGLLGAHLARGLAGQNVALALRAVRPS